MKVNKKKLLVLMFIICFVFSATPVFALSGWLDDYAGTGYSDVGNYSVDSFSISDGTFYASHSITGSNRWDNGGTAGMRLTPAKKGTLGYSKITSKAQSVTKDPYDESYETLSFTGLSSGTYKIYFSSIYQDYVDFEGTVYDYN